jgi:hypothetical protein
LARNVNMAKLNIQGKKDGCGSIIELQDACSQSRLDTKIHIGIGRSGKHTLVWWCDKSVIMLDLTFNNYDVDNNTYTN